MATAGERKESARSGDQGPLGGELISVGFAAMARRLSETARNHGVTPPAFRSPPRTPGLRRSMRSESDGSLTVSVALRRRPAIAVVGDMIDGVVAASGAGGQDAANLRDVLWDAAATLLDGDQEAARGSQPATFAA